MEQMSNVLNGGPPTAIVCGKTKGEVKKNELLNMKTIELRGCVQTAKVTGFKLTVVQIRKDGEKIVVSYTAEDGSLTERMKALIKNSLVGSKVYFEQIDVVDAVGKKYDIEPVVVTIG